MHPFTLQKCLVLSGESVKSVSFLYDNIDTSKVLLYVGTNKGSLQVHHINRSATLPGDNRNDYDAEELTSVVIQRKRPVRQIQAVGGSVQGVVVLCDGRVSLHHLRNLDAIQHFDRHRQVSHSVFDKGRSSGNDSGSSRDSCSGIGMRRSNLFSSISSICQCGFAIQETFDLLGVCFCRFYFFSGYCCWLTLSYVNLSTGFAILREQDLWRPTIPLCCREQKNYPVFVLQQV